MAKKATGSTSSSASKKTVSSTSVRNSPIPKSTTQTTASRGPTAPTSRSGGRQPTHEEIAKRAYEIWRSGKGGSQFENWVRAERELRAQ
jgi:Protein of unknown function (DUF2934)